MPEKTINSSIYCRESSLGIFRAQGNPDAPGVFALSPRPNNLNLTRADQPAKNAVSLVES
jgi:hypothetical protein